MTRAQTDDKLVESYYSHYHRFSDDFVANMKKSGNYNIKTMRQTLMDKKALNPKFKLLQNPYK